MKHVLHALLAALGFVTWALAMALMTVTTLLALTGHRLLPNATRGNCWTYALPRFALCGGYLLIRPADGQKLFNVLPVPHVIWVHEVPRHGLGLKQFVPTKKVFGKWFPLHTIYYVGTVRNSEKPHNSTNSGDMP